MRILIRVAALLLVSAVADNAHAQRLAVVTTVMPGTRMPAHGRAGSRGRSRCGSCHRAPPWPNRWQLPEPNRATRGRGDLRRSIRRRRSRRLPITVPITFPLAYRDTVTGASGTIVEDVQQDRGRDAAERGVRRVLEWGRRYRGCHRHPTRPRLRRREIRQCACCRARYRRDPGGLFHVAAGARRPDRCGSAPTDTRVQPL